MEASRDIGLSLLGNPQIGFSIQDREAGAQRTATSSLSALDAALTASGIPYKAGGQSSKRGCLRPGPRWRLKGRGCSIKLSKDYTGISWTFKQLLKRTEGRACVLTPPTLTLWLTGVRTSSVTTPDTKPLVPLPLGSPFTPQAPAACLASCFCLSSVYSSAPWVCPKCPVPSGPFFPFEVTVLTSCKRSVMLSVRQGELLGRKA